MVATVRILIPLLVVGLLLASEIVRAAPERIPCLTGIQKNRAVRMIRYNLPADCDPTFIPAPGELFLCPTSASRRRAERMIRFGMTPLCAPRTSSLPSSSSSSSSTSSVSSLSSSSSASSILDTRDTTLRSQILLLGETTPVLGAASFFIEEEPIDARKFSITFTGSTPSIRSLLVYDDTSKFLGRATLLSGNTYRLTVAPETFSIGKRESRGIYVRGELAPYLSGGVSGEDIKISSVSLEAVGVWSSETYTKTSTEDFPHRFFAARGAIVSVGNALGASAPLVAGTDRTLGSFTFTARTSDSSARVDLTDLSFTLSTSGGASVSNVALLTEGIPDRHSCSVVSSTITCSSIPATFGSLAAPRTLTLRGDISAPSDDASVRVSLGSQGTPTSAGSVTWTDGTTSFTWLPLPNAGSIVDGTYWSN